MCGIAGVLNADRVPVDREAVRAMRDCLSHRGPDDAGLWLDGEAGLAHRRLSILDLSPSGHQPMTNEDETLWLVFNGEIYNFPELGTELRARGHRFRSATDSEVILHLYEEMGPDCVRRLRGMFAFIIFDTRTRRMFGARDRTGIKPLYYVQSSSGFAFASEVKALLGRLGAHRGADDRGLADYLFCGRPLEDRTLIEGVRALQPGHWLMADGTSVRSEPYWRLEFNYRRDRSMAAVVDELRSRLEDSVAVHCLSDAPLGAHLSGGLDSSTVATLAARGRAAPLDTFAIRFEGGERFDETRFSRSAARHAGARLHVATPSAAALSRLYPSLLWHLDYPVPGDPGFTYAAAARLAADHVKVSLTGHGGDEIFAGYPAQFATSFGSTDAFARSPSAPTGSRPGLTRRLRRSLRAGGLVRRLLPGRSGPWGELTGAERTWVAYHCGPDPLHDPVLHPGFRKALSGYSPVDPYLKEFRDAPTDETLDRCLHHDLRTYLPQLLHKEDRASMAVSLESRVPLLDHELIEFLATVPPDQKVPDGEPKGLLRAAARTWLPAEVVDRRDKSPFPIPVRQWIEEDLGAWFRGLLAEERTLDRGIFHPAELRNPALEPDLVLQLANVELWFRMMVDGDAAPTPLPPSEEWWDQPAVVAA